MTGFDRRRSAGIDSKLRYLGRGCIQAALFDLGSYPAAVPAGDSRVWGEVYEVTDVQAVLATLDEIEGYSTGDPSGSLYKRIEVDVTFEARSRASPERAPDHASRRANPERAPDHASRRAWVYFYNGPTGHLPRIPSGDYRQHVERLP